MDEELNTEDPILRGYQDVARLRATIASGMSSEQIPDSVLIEMATEQFPQHAERLAPIYKKLTGEDLAFRQMQRAQNMLAQATPNYTGTGVPPEGQLGNDFWLGKRQPTPSETSAAEGYAAANNLPTGHVGDTPQANPQAELPPIPPADYANSPFNRPYSNLPTSGPRAWGAVEDVKQDDKSTPYEDRMPAGSKTRTTPTQGRITWGPFPANEDQSADNDDKALAEAAQAMFNTKDWRALPAAKAAALLATVGSQIPGILERWPSLFHRR